MTKVNCLASTRQLEVQMSDPIESVIQIHDVNKVEPGKRSLRIHMHEQGQRPITLQLGPSSVRKLATLLERCSTTTTTQLSEARD